MRNNRSSVTVLGLALFVMLAGMDGAFMPAMLGRAVGAAYPWSMVGFLLSGVGFPLLAFLAVARADGGIDEFATRVSPGFARALTIVLLLAIGPCFVLPSSAAAVYEMAILPSFPLADPLVFSVLYFGIVLAIALRPLSALDRVGAFLAPLVISALGLLIFKGILQPIGAP